MSFLSVILNNSVFSLNIYIWLFIVFAIFNVKRFFSNENARKISNLISFNVMVACYSASDCVSTANPCQYDFTS